MLGRNREILKKILLGTSQKACSKEYNISEGSLLHAAVLCARKIKFAFCLPINDELLNKAEIMRHKKILLKYIDQPFSDIFSYVSERVIQSLRDIFGNDLEARYYEIEAYDEKTLQKNCHIGRTGLAGLKEWIQSKKKTKNRAKG